jgi:hypothetical protein
MNHTQLDKFANILSEKRMHTREMIGDLQELSALMGANQELTQMIELYRAEQDGTSNKLYNIWTRMAELKDNT